MIMNRSVIIHYVNNSTVRCSYRGSNKLHSTMTRAGGENKIKIRNVSSLFLFPL